MPIDADGTVVGQASGGVGIVDTYPSQSVVLGWVTATSSPGSTVVAGQTYCFFPEARTCLGGIWSSSTAVAISGFEGSNDTANGSDGTWEMASAPSGYPPNLGVGADTWRASVKPFTFTGAKATVRFSHPGNLAGTNLNALHLYGVKGAGQTPDDILFLDGDNAFAEYTVDKDFGDRPLGTTVVKQFKLKNSSATKTATTIVVTCNDADFAISTDGVTYVTTFTLSSLGPAVSSAVLYIRNTTPSPGTALGPRQVRLSAAVGSYV